jgi:hypothetical protein
MVQCGYCVKKMILSLYMKNGQKHPAQLPANLVTKIITEVSNVRKMVFTGKTQTRPPFEPLELQTTLGLGT